MIERVPHVLLRVEGLVVLATALILYVDRDYSLAALGLVLAPDLSMIGYAGGPRVGAAAYNAAHTEAIPLALGAFGAVAGSGLLVQIALIWLVHIGADRLLGYGLKYPTAFKDTHLQRV